MTTQISKFKIVKKALEENPQVIIVDLKLESSFPRRIGYVTQTANFSIAPSMGLYTANELQEFMQGLIPGLKPYAQGDFFQADEIKELHFGYVGFEEKIGEERIESTHVMTDPEFTQTFDYGKGLENVYGLDEEGILVRRKVIDHLRRTWVNLYPNEQFAKDLLEGKIDSTHKDRTKLGFLEKYKVSGARKTAALLLELFRAQ